ncbi:hypothetical protein MSAR_33080 [Mycolicibacterium sarraceniae]|uniref:CinA C-terminal domain-containing protein n=1 Tax=Mycolicibacterium sarraceniae TaxID=1534348 RepID=A0A7I7ST44_9MYCO|nr:hypothetical protein MSAR_33080 [Mycolicibacterium sarraceniae]
MRDPLVGDAARALVARGQTVATAESLTGGLTGVAGPEPHGGYPVGTVYLGLAGPGRGLPRSLSCGWMAPAGRSGWLRRVRPSTGCPAWSSEPEVSWEPNRRFAALQ